MNNVVLWHIGMKQSTENRIKKLEEKLGNKLIFKEIEAILSRIEEENAMPEYDFFDEFA